MQTSDLLLKASNLRWYALHTKPRHEKVVNERLQEKGFETYLPLRTVVKQWSDRKKKIDEPLFKGYLFVRMFYKNRINVLETEGIVRLVMFKGRPGIIHDQEIEAIKRFLDLSKGQHSVYIDVANGLIEGDLVEITSGPLIGLQGYLSQRKNADRFSVRIENIGKTLFVEVPAGILQKARKIT